MVQRYNMTEECNSIGFFISMFRKKSVHLYLCLYIIVKNEIVIYSSKL